MVSATLAAPVPWWRYPHTIRMKPEQSRELIWPLSAASLVEP